MGTRIHLVVTGDAEELALSSALDRLFPKVEFTVAKVYGLTSNILPRDPTEPRQEAIELVSTMLAAIDAGRTPANYAIALDDLEQANADQPEVVLQHLRLAVERCVNQPPEVEVVARGSKRRFRQLATPQARRTALRERCSFHLAAPMLEAWFFGEPAALRRAGVPGATKVVFDKHICDIEDFVTTDAMFLDPTATAYWAHRAPEKRVKHEGLPHLPPRPPGNRTGEATISRKPGCRCGLRVPGLGPNDNAGPACADGRGAPRRPIGDGEPSSFVRSGRPPPPRRAKVRRLSS